MFLNNNATTLMPESVVREMVAWVNCGNPSDSHESARSARKMIDAFRAKVAAECDVSLDGPDGFEVVLTSGGSEGNAHILTACARAFANRTGKLPHIVTSAVEHSSVLRCCRALEAERLAAVTILPVLAVGDGAGTVDPPALAGALRPNTCLVSIMAACNETGALNNIKALAALAHAQDVPFHTDAVQLFGRSRIRPNLLGIDAFTASMHKLHGPPGVGLLVVRRSLVEGYALPALIAGSQNAGLRGGTENVPGVAASAAAFALACADRPRKNAETRRLRDSIWAALAAAHRAEHVDHYSGLPGDDEPPAFVRIGPADLRLVLPNTLFIAVARRGFCNVEAKRALERLGYIVSVGSACNTASEHASHVVTAMRVPDDLRAGVLRVSLSDDTTAEEARGFAEALIAVASGPLRRAGDSPSGGRDTDSAGRTPSSRRAAKLPSGAPPGPKAAGQARGRRREK